MGKVLKVGRKLGSGRIMKVGLLVLLGWISVSECRTVDKSQLQVDITIDENGNEEAVPSEPSFLSQEEKAKQEEQQSREDEFKKREDELTAREAELKRREEEEELRSQELIKREDEEEKRKQLELERRKEYEELVKLELEARAKEEEEREKELERRKEHADLLQIELDARAHEEKEREKELERRKEHEELVELDLDARAKEEEEREKELERRKGQEELVELDLDARAKEEKEREKELERRKELESPDYSDSSDLEAQNKEDELRSKNYYDELVKLEEESRLFQEAEERAREQKTRGRREVSNRENLQVDVTRDVKCATVRKAREGDKVTVHYGGFLQDGKKFDSSFDRSQPFTFTLGVGQVIPGWDEGLLGVCKGEERHLVVPAGLAYGERGAGDVIPPGSTLLFDIVIVDVQRIDNEEDKQRKAEEEERKHNELEKEKEQEHKRQNELKTREEELKRREEEEELRKQELLRREEEEEKRQEEIQKRKEQEELVKREEEARVKEERERKKELERRRKEEDTRRKPEVKKEVKKVQGGKAPEGTRRKEDEEYYYDENEEYYYDYPSKCEPGELKMQVTYSPARCGRLTRTGDRLTMHYTGKLASGQKFDSSLDRNKPFQFTLGEGQVIAGWDSGLEGMCVGERRTLVIPPDQAYGEQGVGSVIPACSTLIFDVELIDIEN